MVEGIKKPTLEAAQKVKAGQKGKRTYYYVAKKVPYFYGKEVINLGENGTQNILKKWVLNGWQLLKKVDSKKRQAAIIKEWKNNQKKLDLTIPWQANREKNKPIISDEEKIRNLNKAYLSNWLENNERGVLALFTEDARISPNSMPPIDSLSNMRQFWFPKDDSITTINQFDAEELSLRIEGDMAFVTQQTLLDWSYVKDKFKMRQAQKGIDTSVYKKQADGTWKIWRKSWIDYEVIKK